MAEATGDGRRTVGAESIRRLAKFPRRVALAVAARLAVLDRDRREAMLDFRLRRTTEVRRHGRAVFRMIDMGPITRRRARTFEEKEPETLAWIESFAPGDVLLDVGANVGIYTLFAASRGHRTIAVEPEALNYAALNLNIALNSLAGLATAFPIAFHDDLVLETFHLQLHDWGAALGSVGEARYFRGRAFVPAHRQGVVGLALDAFVGLLGDTPSHLKIDVDGNEWPVLRGGRMLLADPALRSLLIELDEEDAVYGDVLALLESSGLELEIKTHAPMFDHGDFSTVFNHVFRRRGPGEVAADRGGDVA